MPWQNERTETAPDGSISQRRAAILIRPGIKSPGVPRDGDTVFERRANANGTAYPVHAASLIDLGMWDPQSNRDNTPKREV